MRPTRTYLGLIAMTLVLASGTGTAQTFAGEAYAEGQTEVHGPQVETTQTNAQQSNDLYADAYAETEASAEVTTEEVASEIDMAELEAMLDELAAEPEDPEPTSKPSGETPQPEPAPEVPPEEVHEDFDVYTDGNGSIDANASSETYAHVEHTDPEPVIEPPEQAPQQEPEPTPEPEDPGMELNEDIEMVLDGSSEAQAFLDTREGKVIEMPEPSEEPSEEQPASVDVNDEGGFSFGLRAAFEATTSGFASAVDELQGHIDGLVGQVKGLFEGSASTSTELDHALDIEAVEGLEGSLDVAGDVTANVEGLVGTVELPEIAVPEVQLSTVSEVNSETSVEGSILGDLGIGL